jgi:Fe2+ transport system protein B
MSDIADSRGVRIDTDTLSEHLGGIAVVRVTATRGDGLEELSDQVLNLRETIGALAYTEKRA